MFGVTTGCLVSQLAAPMSCSVSQLNILKASTARTSHHQQRQKSAAATGHLQASVRDTSKLLGVTEAVADKLSKTLTSTILLESASTSQQNIRQILHQSRLLAIRPAWHESHASFSSFTENKQGYSQSTSAVCNLFSQFKHFYQGNRGFKTRHSQRETQTLQMPEIGKSKIFSKLEIPLKDKLTTMVSQETSEEAKKNMKIAFAEGYMSGDGKNKSHWSKFISMFQLFFLVATTITMVLLFSGTSAALRMRTQIDNQVQPEDINVSFNDVRGAEEAKLELQEIVDFLKNPSKYTSLGAELPKGVILVGQPGTGKTLLARAVAGEAGVPFFHAAGSEFDEVLVGQGAKRIRDLFGVAKSKAPCVIFIDEIDSVGSKRSSSTLHPFANQTINQLLSELDGFVKNEGVIVLGATNRRGDLDKALLRPGRFDVEVQVSVPDLTGRMDIFRYYLSKIKYGPDVEVDVLSRGTTGFTGADIKNVVNQAALKAAANDELVVTMHHLEEARDKVLMGPKKKSRIPDEETNTITAYHEGGHAIVSYFTKGSHPLHKVTIIPRGPSLGHTAYIPAKEQYNVTRTQMYASMDSLMGGRAAEELIFGPEAVTTGASNDLEKATQIATSMVKDMGMSEKVGLRTFSDDSSVAIKIDDLSVSTKEAIDTEIKRLLTESYERAKNILKTHSREHKDLAEALLKHETLDSKDIRSIIEGKSFS